jgi:CheY-like chemotaxis protein
MKLDYNIIWVDDKIETRPFNACINTIKKFLNDEFFNCDVQIAKDLDKFKVLFNKNSNYDLIITDLSLNEGSTGKEVINYVRDNKHNHTEIFFYSANTQLKNIELINNNRITFYQLTEGNYRELSTEVSDLIKLTISKFQHIVSMRGMIMNETSSLDVELSEIATKILKEDLPKIKDQYPSLNFEEIKKQFFANIQKHANEKCNKVFSNKLKDVLKDDTIFNASEKNNVIGYFIEELIKQDVQIENFTSEYKDSIISVRNNFAHAELLTDINGRQYFKKGDFTFDDEKCKKIREDIIKHKKNIEGLKEKLNEK